MELFLPGSCQRWVMTRRLNAKDEGTRVRGLASIVWKVFFLGLFVLSPNMPYLQRFQISAMKSQIKMHLGFEI